MTTPIVPLVFLCIFFQHCKLSFWGLRSMENHQNWKRDKLSKSNIVQVYHLDFLSILRLLQFHPLLLHARIKGLFFILNRSINVNFLNCRWVCTIYKLGPSKKYTIFYDFIIILRVSLMKLWIWLQFWSEELRFS